MPADEPTATYHANDTDSAVIFGTTEAVTFEPGHRMRAARCLICRDCIGGTRAVVIAIAPLIGEACPCGGIDSDAWLIHAGHLPMPPAELQTAIKRGLECGNN